MFLKKTIRDIDLSGKKVLVRTDYNVPISRGVITSNFRITQSIPTIKYLQEKGCRIIICSHLGRPAGYGDNQFSLKPIAKELSKVLDQPVYFVPDCVGDEVARASSELKAGEILVIENLRYYEEEEQNDSQFAQELIDSCGAEIFVQEAFGVVHRAHASTDQIAKKLPSVAGLLLEKEVDTITNVMLAPKKPLMAIIGGAKIADKIDIIYKFIEIADVVAIGGAMANTFLLAGGVKVGASLVDEEELDTANDVIEKARSESKKRKFIFYLPQDGVAATDIDKKSKTRVVDWDSHIFADIESYPKRAEREDSVVAKDEKILDIGPFSGAFITGAMQLSETVVWNGTMGVTEVPSLQGPIGPFAHGTELIIDGLVGGFGSKPFSLIGGGDTTAYIENRKMNDMFDHVSTGGGASLELMAGKKLPGIEVLGDK